MNLYAENVMDHYKNPHNKKNIEDCTVSHKEFNPLCGDEVKMQMKIEDDKIIDVAFEGHGCVISQASASMVTDYIKGRTIKQVKNITREDVLDLLGIPIGPVRLKCALLCFHAIMNTIKQVEASKK